MPRDYFAEMYVAGLLADAGWNIYFPHRDMGFDYIITRQNEAGVLIRAVQVKGLYPEATTKSKVAYGYRGRLSALHRDMVLILPFFPPGAAHGTPQHIAYMPRWQIRPTSRAKYRCVPAAIKKGIVSPRRDFSRYFDAAGLAAMNEAAWSNPPE